MIGMSSKGGRIRLMLSGRKLVYPVIALVLAISSIGCSRTGGSSQVPDPAARQVNLNLLNYSRFPADALQGIIQAFEEKYPNVKVHVYTPSDRPVPRDLAAPFEGIDVLLLTSLQTQEMGRAGLLKELPAMRLPSLEGALPEVVYDLSTVEGRRLGLPVGLSPALIAVNQQWLSEAGVPLPPLDWTWADYEQAVAPVMQAGRSAKLDGQILLEPILRAYGGRMYDGDRAAWTLDTPESAQGLAQFERLIKLGSMRTEGPGGPPTDQAFSVVSSVQEMPEGMTLYPLPRGPKGRRTPVEALIGAVPTAATHPELAMEFVSLLNTRNAQLHLARAGVRPVTADEEVLSVWRQTVGDRMVQIWELVVNDLYMEWPPLYPKDVLSSLAPYFRGEAKLDSVISDLSRRTSARQ